MSDIDFQNGFIVGMATRGITRSGLMYAPLVWNDDGVYSYFYIDFKKPVADFSLGMFTESVVVHDSVQLAVSGVARVSSSVFKVYVDISGRFQGITVLNKITTYLAFTTGEEIPPFSVHFFVEGISRYERMKYLYEKATFENTLSFDSATENVSSDLWDSFDEVIPSESITFLTIAYSANESVSVTLT